MKGRLIFPIVCLLFFVSYSWAITGLEIAQKVYSRNDGRDFYVQMQMTLIDKHGQQRIRTMVMAEKDYGSLRKVFIRFLSPADIKDTTFLAWENKDREDDQFLYLPALRRVRRIVSSKKDNSFVNSDFTYEDMERRKPQKDVHTLLREERYQGWDCWVLQSIPKKNSHSQYGKIISWIVKGIYIPVRMDLYNRKGELIKQFLVHKLKCIQGIWTATDTEMINLKEHHRTRLVVKDIKYNLGLSDEMFTKRYMSR